MTHSNVASDRDLTRSVQVDGMARAIGGIRDVQARLLDKPILDLADLPDIQRAIEGLQSIVDTLKS